MNQINDPQVQWLASGAVLIGSERAASVIAVERQRLLVLIS